MSVGVGAATRPEAATFGDTYLEEGDCGKCYDAEVGGEELRGAAMSDAHSASEGADEDGYAHVFGNLWFYPGKKMSCTLFNSCHTNSQPGRCTEFHYACPGGDVVLAAVPVLEVAIARSDVETISTLLSAHESTIGYDRSAGELVLLDCDARVVRRLAMPQSLAPVL